MKVLESSVNPGDQLDHYRIDSVVVRSAVGTIFRATDLRTNRPVAIKVPHPDVESDPPLSDQFRREEEIGKLLDHPGIIKVIPEHPRTQLYVVMEWFDGTLLSQILSEKKIAPERAVRIVIAICDALQYIHSHGIVHRDLRPENIMVDGEDRIKLIDFAGAAKAVARRLTFATLAQITGASEYISPEELLGKRGDARSDIYALGIILYEMVTGKKPFTESDLFYRTLSPPVPPREIDPAISPQLQEVIYRAIEREPRNRYANVHDFARDLEHLDQVGVADRPELHHWKKRRSQQSRKVLLYVALALIPIVVFAALLYFAGR